MLVQTLAILLASTPTQAARPAQTPCPVVQAPADADDWRKIFRNIFVVGEFAVRVTEGSSSNCIFDASGNGRCLLTDPRTFEVIIGAEQAWYEAPANEQIEIEVYEGRYVCMVGRRIRTHGDFLIPRPF